MHLGIFLKAPLPGRVKTRLSPPLTPQDAASLYAALLADTLQLAAASSAEHILLFYDGGRPHEYLAPSITRALGERALEIEQQGDDLGERLEAAVADAGAQGRLPLLLLGSDSPDLPGGVLEGTLCSLSEYDVVLGPATDGGVWCVGVRRLVPGLFTGVPWSEPTTGAALGERARQLGLTTTLAPPWSDVDTWDDLGALARRLRSGAAHAAFTERWLARYGPLPQPEEIG